MRALNLLMSLLILSPLLLGNGECNAFMGSAEKTSDDALVYTAKQQLDAFDYTSALATIAQISTTKRNSHDGRVLEASAYAGKCGLNFMSFAEDIKNGISSKTLMNIVLGTFKSVTSYSDCKSAETLLTGIAAADMTADDYVFLAFLELAKMGAVLGANANVDSDNDGVAQAGFSPCSAAGLITDLEVGEIGTAINYFVSAANSSGLSVASAATNSYTALCATIVANPLLGAAYSPCGITSPTGFSANQLNALRTLIYANEIGVNTCNGSSYSGSCHCP